jgi:hypothetical protein
MAAAITVSAGTDGERRLALGSGNPQQIASDLWHPESAELSFVDVELVPDLDELLLREAALNDPRDAQRTVWTEAAKLLARHDWTGLLTPADDFVVFFAEHDEGFTEKHASVREINPPERVAAWDAAWPSGVPRDD